MASIFFFFSFLIALLAEMNAEALIHHVQVLGSSEAKEGERFPAVIFKEKPGVPGLDW